MGRDEIPLLIFAPGDTFALILLLGSLFVVSQDDDGGGWEAKNSLNRKLFRESQMSYRDMSICFVVKRIHRGCGGC